MSLPFRSGLCSVSCPGHSMMDTLAVALRVAEEAIEEAISKAEAYGDSLVYHLPPVPQCLSGRWCGWGPGCQEKVHLWGCHHHITILELSPPSPYICGQDSQEIDCQVPQTHPQLTAFSSSLCRTSRMRPVTCGTTRRSWLRSWPQPSCRR